MNFVKVILANKQKIPEEGINFSKKTLKIEDIYLTKYDGSRLKAV